MNSKVVHSIWVLLYNACHYSRSCHCHLQQEKVFEDLTWNFSFPTILLVSISHLSFTWNALVLLGYGFVKRLNLQVDLVSSLHAVLWWMRGHQVKKTRALQWSAFKNKHLLEQPLMSVLDDHRTAGAEIFVRAGQRSPTSNWNVAAWCFRVITYHWLSLQR